MALTLTAAPAVEPLTLAEAKAHCRLDGDAEDALLASLIKTSRLHIEQALGLALVTQRWSWKFDSWPKGGALSMPLRPVQSIESISVANADGSAQTLESWQYVLDGHAAPPRLLPTASRFPDPGRLALGIGVDFTAGFGASADDVPGPIRQALLLLVAHWFENREPVVFGASGGAPARIPDTVSELLFPYRTVRL